MHLSRAAYWPERKTADGLISRTGERADRCRRHGAQERAAPGEVHCRCTRSLCDDWPEYFSNFVEAPFSESDYGYLRSECAPSRPNSPPLLLALQPSTALALRMGGVRRVEVLGLVGACR
eukprot:975095-Rhodomonas_salina.3